jgi:acetylornithine deacetylase/succinyl-diaminopimelate desuccinylase-like protein
MQNVTTDPSFKVVPETKNQRPGAPPSRIDTPAFHAIEAAYAKVYGGLATLPVMATGATDMAFLRAKGVQCYGIGAMRDDEDALKGFGAHSDQERILEESLYKHFQFFWEATTAIAASNR